MLKKLLTNGCAGSHKKDILEELSEAADPVHEQGTSGLVCEVCLTVALHLQSTCIYVKQVSHRLHLKSVKIKLDVMSHTHACALVN